MDEKVPLFYIDGVLVNPPEEYRGIELELNFSDIDQVRVAISQEKFTFVNENATLLNTYKTAGTSGGLGIFFGVPFRIELDTQVLFDGYIDLAKEATFSCNKVVCKVKESKTLDWMEETADGFSFDGLFADGFITEDDFLDIPYQQSDIPDYKQAALFFLYAFVIERELEGAIKDIVYTAADLAGVFSTVAGVIKAIFLVAYLTALTIALFKIVKNMLAELISPVKYHRGMLAVTHFEAACAKVGLTFRSSLFQANVPSNIKDINGVAVPSGYWADECVIPEKYKEGYKKGARTDQRGYYNGTFGDFIRAMEAKCHARMTITNGVMNFERSDYGVSTKVYQIPDVRRDEHETNADQLVSNYLVQYQVDNLDLNTVNNYLGTNAKNFISSKNKDATKTELIRGFKQPSILFARGTRKDSLTRVESLTEDFLVVIDKILNVVYDIIEALVSGLAAVVKVINVIIGGINTVLPSNADIKKITVPYLKIQKSQLNLNISNRLGVLLLSGDFIGVPKLVLITGTGWNIRVTTDNNTRQSAENVWNKYHFIESMVPNAARSAGNQAFIYNIPVIPFCLEDYYRVRGLDNGNKGEAAVISPEGKPAKILSLKWNIYRNKASIRYAEEKLFTNNLTETLLINAGN